MKSINKVSYITILGFTFLFTVVLTGCKNNAAGNEEEDHFPIGVVLKIDEEEIVRYEGPSSVIGSIDVEADEETDLISIYFLEEDGNEFQPDEPDHSLQWTVEDESIAEIEQHSEEGKWNFHVIGNSSGSTTVTFELLHGNHSDFKASGIPINVN